MLWKEVLWSESGSTASILSLEIGYFLWVISMIILLVNSILLFYKKDFKLRYIKILILSILIFCSISFVTIINDLNIPALGFVDNPCTLKIGFPYTFYHQFLVESPIPNSGWGKEIIIDYFFTSNKYWVVLFE
jgi:hypothetical protein